MKKKLFKTRLLSFAAFCGLTFAFVSCANEDVAQNPNSTDNDKNLTTFSTGVPSTRTTMESNGKFFWEAGDKIWVQDDDSTWRQSYNAPIAKTDNFKFKVPGKFTKGSTYKVYYPGKNGNQNQVTISANQSQSEPNTTAHFGASGDCGMADAAWSNTKNGFEFSLDHKAAYLLLLPRTSNTILQKCYLTKVEVNSDNDITDTYTLNPTTGKLTGTRTGKQIIVSTGGSGAYANGFPLTNTAASAATNGSYVVIKPGTHTLKIRYWVKDMVTNVEGVITKTLATATYEQNKYYNITANFDVPDYDGDHYYMWDAQEQYWKGYEWTKNLGVGVGQPTLYGQPAGNYPQNNADSRYYHEGGGELFNAIRFDATHTSCKDLPNVNEMTWYAAYGEPRWDADKLWTAMGHLYKGGMWFKKKSVLQAENHYNSNIAADGRDWRTIDGDYTWDISTTPPSAADANKYFFLPALGSYGLGKLNSLNSSGQLSFGFYWSSSANPEDSRTAYGLYFSRGMVNVNDFYRTAGFRVDGFK